MQTETQKITGRSIIENADPYIDEKLPAKIIEALIVSIESAMQQAVNKSIVAPPIESKLTDAEIEKMAEECFTEDSIITLGLINDKDSYMMGFRVAWHKASGAVEGNGQPECAGCGRHVNHCVCP